MIPAGQRKLAAVIVLGTAMSVVVAQTPKVATESVKVNEKTEPERDTLPKFDDLPEVKVQASDAPEVKAAKERLLAAKKKHILVYVRMSSGQFNMASAHKKLVDNLCELTELAQVIYSDPKDQLPWFEYRLAVTKEMPNYTTVVGECLDEPGLRYCQTEQEKAEQALKKVQAKVKK